MEDMVAARGCGGATSSGPAAGCEGETQPTTPSPTGTRQRDLNRGALPPDRTQAILEATKQLAALLKAGGHPFALAGSVAAYAHGAAVSLQHDADFCVLREDADAVAVTLREAGIDVHAPAEDWLVKARCGGVEIDLIFDLSHLPVDRELLDRAETLPVDSVRMPVLTPTDLLGSLVAAFSEHHCDFAAVLPIARTLRERVDWDRLRLEHRDAPMPAAFFFLLERLDVIESQEACR
ncbi:nucleotidyltransferase family protein [Actinacidiphila oryziradicis]|nr:nucleotidyltransferase family protein [Actinacidiphila oryziradicis]